MRAIFLSYRRDDAEGEAGRLFDDLSEVFAEDSVFMDVEAIEKGRDFREAIEESVASCKVLLAVIGRSWIGATDESCQPRLADPNDFVRLEIKAALQRNIPVIPVLVHGARIPRPDQLPEDIRNLAYRNGVELTGPRWRTDVQVLTKALQPHVNQNRKPPPPDRKPIPVKKILGIAVVVAILAVVGYLALWYVSVPNVVGTTEVDAVAKLVARSLPVGQRTTEESTTSAPGTVIGQSPKPGARVKKGTAIDLVLSQSPPTAKVEIPNIIGKTLEAARLTLSERHLQVGKLEMRDRSDSAANVVLNVFPPVGETVSAGTKLDLVVSQAPPSPPPPNQSTLVNPPNLIGKTVIQAQAELRNAHLSVGTIVEQVRAGVAHGTVISQSPSPRQQIATGSRVNLTVAKPPVSADIADIILPITVDASCNPPTVSPGQTTRITVIARRANGSPIPNARVQLTAAGGTFSDSDAANTSGTGDNNGIFRTSWKAPSTGTGSHSITVRVIKEGFQVGRLGLSVQVQ